MVKNYMTKLHTLLFILWLIAPTKAFAETFVIDGLNFTSINDNDVEVGIENYEFAGEIVIPSAVSHNGKEYKVTRIQDNAFSACRSVTAITIPNSITSIGNSAFSYCSSLTSLALPNSVTRIGSWAFYNCFMLESVTMPNSITIIEDGTFSSCRSLKSVTIPNSVTSIESEAFSACFSLKSVTIPNSVTSIGNKAFSYCRSLISVTIPNSVTFLENPFPKCESLENIIVDSDNVNYSSVEGVLYDKKQTKLISYPGAREGSATIPNSVTSIGDYAFYYSRLTSVVIPNSVTSIGDYAFSGCLFTSVTIPNSVMNIGNCAFFLCQSLTSVTIPGSVTNIDAGAFSSCYSLKSVYMESYESPNVHDTAFGDTHAVLFVPYGTISAYSQESWTSVFDLITGFEPASLPDEDFVNHKSEIAVRKSGDTLEILNLEENEPVQIYDFKGVCVYSGTNHTVRLPRNCGYILRAAGQTLKF